MSAVTWDTYVRPSTISEAELMGIVATPGEVARPCVCGRVVVADPRDPSAGVMAHQGTPEHRAWRDRSGL